MYRILLSRNLSNPSLKLAANITPIILVGLHPARFVTGIPYFLAILLFAARCECTVDHSGGSFHSPVPARSLVYFFCAVIVLCVFHLGYFVPSYNSRLSQDPGGLPVRNTIEHCRKLESSVREPEKTVIVTYSPEIAYLCEPASNGMLHTFHVYAAWLAARPKLHPTTFQLPCALATATLTFLGVTAASRRIPIQRMCQVTKLRTSMLFERHDPSLCPCG
jgi:hypothetical protein